MMTKQHESLYRFFTEKAKHLQNEIDMEIARIGGEHMLISREDLIHWVYHSRSQIETYHTICEMLEDRAKGVDTKKILEDLQETAAQDRIEIEKLRRKQAEEQKALKELKEEAEYYMLALEVLGE